MSADIKIGQRIDLIELIDEKAANRLFNKEWLSFTGDLGKQYSHVYYGKNGYCCWNYHIHSGPDSLFKDAFKKIGTFVIKSIK